MSYNRGVMDREELTRAGKAAALGSLLGLVLAFLARRPGPDARA